jgi:hypothetical protein
MRQWIEIKADEDSVRVKNNEKITIDQFIFSEDGSKWQLRNTPSCGLHICKFSKDNDYLYTVQLKPGYTYKLGPSYGHRLITPEEEKDPVKRVLRKHNVSINRLKKLKDEEPASFRVINVDLDKEPSGSRCMNFVTDGTSIPEIDGAYCVGEITDCKYTIQYFTKKESNGKRKNFIDSVFVKRNANLQELDEQIDKILAYK